MRPAPLALAAAAAVLLAVALPLSAVLARAGGGALPGAADWAAFRFTLWQAAASAALSVVLAVPVARALARRSFPGRKALLSLIGAPFVLPGVVAAGAILAVFGRTGAVNRGLAALGLPEIAVYGPQGVILAHVFLNLPLAIRMIVQGWADIPSERFRLAESLSFGPAEMARHLGRPMLRAVAPGAFLTIFLVCLTSFPVVLILGGGPRATTIELAIYQAFRFDFDLARAATLAALQLALSLAATLLVLGVALPAGFGGGLDRAAIRGGLARSPWLGLQDAALIAAAALFLLGPLGFVVAAGAPHLAGLPASVWAAAGRSALVAVAATALAMGLALPIVLGAARMPARAGRRIEAAGMLALVASPLVTGTGAFLLLRPLTDPAALALPLTAAANGLLALPFAIRILSPPAREAEAAFGRLADSLALTGLARARHVTLPRLRRPLGFAAGLAAAISAGDLGVAALFADPDRATLPVAVQRLMGAYRMDQAAGASLLLVGLGLGLFLGFDRIGGGRRAET